MTDSPSDTIRSFCNGCQQETRHTIVGGCSRQRREGNGQFPRIIDEQWQLLQCCGCESIKALVEEHSTDFKSPRETHYPAREDRQMPSWCAQLPRQCQDLIREVYVAMHADCMTLSMMGTRTILDRMLVEILADVGGFERKLQEAVSKGLFTDAQKDTISSAVDAGNAASHRGFRPTGRQLSDVLDIVEHALMGHYVLAASSGRLKNEVPPRSSRGG
jgi:hypothetical protein